MEVSPWPTGVEVSFVVPVRNGGAFLLRSLKSVERLASLSGLAVEVVVVDDGADVDVAAVIASGRLRVPVSVVGGGQVGPSAARNVGAAASRGTLLAFLDVDDIVLPAWSALAPALLDAGAPDSAADPASAARGCCIVEDLTGGARSASAPSWMPGAYLLTRRAFDAAGGFDERVWWGEHHQLGRRVSGLAGAPVVDLAADPPVMVKIHDRTSASLRAYAARRHDAAELERLAAAGPAERAVASDHSAVSLARLGDWPAARAAALRAHRDQPTLRRRARLVLLGVPVARRAWFVTRLTAEDRGRVARRSAGAVWVVTARSVSFVRAAARAATGRQ